MADEKRYQQGLAKLSELDPNAAEHLKASFQSVCPELADFIIAFPFGEVLSREGLDFQTRELATISALTAMGNCQPQLASHIQGALRIGCKPQQIVEVILQMAVYAGFPAAINGMTTAKQVFEAEGVLPLC
ncbi:carboxymuconolactone decarboxylase family protein [Photobacterium sp. 1_MG-2023]|uniref:carboxymuconolactone decarboxylase family protein n=1 Tax=Photobacterium sp. 1_MG-2023 TaxID=3062646 RepID=UPI0026E36A0C|nr:carboxymuconolactone decarboxylase family protein [Photobacterium sp. 1_MG-2023]MDO6706831.1 carboxymuconolactone decarboxylase family protein [Photobacterium sp. 1_MG-2023]